MTVILTSKAYIQMLVLTRAPSRNDKIPVSLQHVKV